MTTSLPADLVPAAADPQLDALMDVALGEIAHYGLARSSLNAIATRAGVSRPTAYRRLGNKDLLIKRLIARETQRFFAGLETATAGIDAPDERAVEVFVLGLHAARTHPLVTGLLAREPESIVPHLTSSGAPAVATMRAAVAHHIDPAHALAPTTADQTAELVVRLLISFLLTPSGAFDTTGDQPTRAFAEAYVRPLVQAALEADRR
jgi:AcrR family transcriptional regulator